MQPSTHTVSVCDWTVCGTRSGFDVEAGDRIVILILIKEPVCV